MNLWLVLCGLLGHSKFTTSCWGYVYCARCDSQVGDNLAGTQADGVCLDFGHDSPCKNCDAQRGKWSWRERLVAWLEEPLLRRKVARDN